MKSIWIAAAVLVIGVSAAPVEGQGFGGNVGVSADPDQFYFGAGYETAELVERLRFRPSVSGIGDEATLITANFEFAYRDSHSAQTLEHVRRRRTGPGDSQFTRRPR